METFDLQGCRMRTISRDPNGVVSRETILSFEQAGDLVFGHYLGGMIAKGYLIGKRVSATSIGFCYVLWVPEILARQFRKFWHVLEQAARPPLSSGDGCATRAHRGG